jgi:hypothetical protein
MPEEKPADPVEKFLLEQKAVEDRKQALIDDLLRQRTDAIKAFDEKLAKLGYNAAAAKRKRSHHKSTSPDTAAPAKNKTKA